MRCFVIIIAIINYTSGVSSLIRTATINYTVPNISTGFFLQDYVHRVNSARVYGSTYPLINESLCQFYLETNRPIDSPDHVISCQFDVAYPKDPTNYYNITDSAVVAITKDTALLILSEGSVHNLYVLRFSDCTAMMVNDTSIRAFTTGFSVQTPHGKMFDVLLDVPERNDTEKVIFRRIIVDLEGKVVDDVPEWYLFPDIPGDTVLLYSPTKGRLVVLFDYENQYEDSEKWMMKILAIDDNGSSQMIKEYAVSNNSYMVVSTTNELLTACFGVDGFDSTRLTCVQLDPNGEVKFEILSLQLADEHSMQEVHNLPGGGFMLITVMCLEKLENGFCPYENNEPLVTKIDRTGSIVGSLKIENLYCNHYSPIHFFKDETESLCFSQVCPLDDTDDQVSLQMICSDDEDYVHMQSTPKVIGQAARTI